MKIYICVYPVKKNLPFSLDPNQTPVLYFPPFSLSIVILATLFQSFLSQSPIYSFPSVKMQDFGQPPFSARTVYDFVKEACIRKRIMEYNDTLLR